MYKNKITKLSLKYPKHMSHNESPINTKGNSLISETIQATRPSVGLRAEIEKRYSRLAYGKLQRIERLFDKKFHHKECLNEDNFAKCIFSGEDKMKRSSSLRKSTSESIKRHFKEIRKDMKMSLDQKIIDDDIKKLGKLSMMNMEARYELLNANKLMIDLDLELVKIQITLEYA